MWRQRTSRLCPDRAADEGRPRPERVRGVASRHRRHRPCVECLEDRRLLSAITEFPLPAGSNAPDLTVGPDGNLWFPLNGLGTIGRITPSGAFTQFPLPAGSNAPDLTVGPDGSLWFPEDSFNGKSPGAIGRITPAGALTEFPLPTVGISASALTVGPDGNLWFPEYSQPLSGQVPQHPERFTSRQS